MSEYCHRLRARQLHSFEGLECQTKRGVRPTDIDFLVDYNGGLFIIAEGKVKGVELTTGQKKAFDNLCNVFRHSEGCHILWVLKYEHEVNEKHSNENVIDIDADTGQYVDVLVRNQYVTEMTCSHYDESVWKWGSCWNSLPQIGEMDDAIQFELVDNKLTMQSAVTQIENWYKQIGKL